MGSSSRTQSSRNAVSAQSGRWRTARRCRPAGSRSRETSRSSARSAVRRCCVRSPRTEARVRLWCRPCRSAPKCSLNTVRSNVGVSIAASTSRSVCGCGAVAVRCRRWCGPWAHPIEMGAVHRGVEHRCILARRRRSGCGCTRADRRPTRSRIRCGVARQDPARSTGRRYRSSLADLAQSPTAHPATRHLRYGPGLRGRRCR